MSAVPLRSDHQDHPILRPIVGNILDSAGGADVFAEKVPALLRQAIDEVIDAPRTNRFTLAETEKTEKTYLGTKIEILLRSFLGLRKGKRLDLLVGDTEVDIKNTMAGNWTIPLECRGHPALLIRTTEATALCDVGLLIARPEYLNPGQNRDQKSTISATAMPNIWWLLYREPYPPNFWEVLPVAQRHEIMNENAGTARLAKLFSLVQGKPISRNQIQAVAQQHDYMKRIRRNGGARDVLAPKGIALLWGQKDRRLIKELKLGPVMADQFISYTPKNPNEVDLLRQAGHIS